MLRFIFCSEIQLTPHVTWFDNFAKTFAKRTPTLEGDTFSLRANCGMGYHQYENPDVPCTLRMNPFSPDFFPAMPDDLFDEAMYRVVQRKLLQAIQPIRKYYERSLVKRYRITTVPLKPEPAWTSVFLVGFFLVRRRF